MKTRIPAVAGKFYPGTKSELIAQIEQILQKEKPAIQTQLAKKNIFGGIVPHAGYMYSGYQAVHFFEIIRQSETPFETFVIINPNHSGFGAEIALDDNDYWETPLGKAEVDSDLGYQLGFPRSADAHKYEHSGEVMLPLLQYFIPTPFAILPITLTNQNVTNSRIIANRIKEAADTLKRRICVIASSDFTHFETAGKGRMLDEFVVKEILGLNTAGVEQEVKTKNISVCGFGPIMALMEYAKQCTKEPQVTLLKRGHSGEVIPSHEVVDYISMLFYSG
ncbi:MAG: AmmeMemoRadiSam system protein B [Bacteroidales bacterium]|nr:AmmeMemoRadiSam system protein B [Bacteroidales bacterium]MCF8404381.1 AmmeMemoRadiSam system protein B [Bacteroidales bacterium]